MSLGHNVSVGPMVGPDPASVLPGWSLGGGYQLTPTRGMQGVVNGTVVWPATALALSDLQRPARTAFVSDNLVEIIFAKRLSRSPHMFVLPITEALFGAFITLAGVALLCRPPWFLRIIDLLNPKRQWHDGGEWRQHVHEPLYKVMGIVFAIFGLFILLSMLARLL